MYNKRTNFVILIKVILLFLLFYILLGCQTPTNNENSIVKVITQIDTIKVKIYDTIKVEHKINRIVYDTLIKTINDTNIVKKVVSVIENNINSNLQFDTTLIFDNRIFNLHVDVKNNEIGIDVLSNGLVNNQIELVGINKDENKFKLLENWWILFLAGFVAGILVFFALRVFAKWIFNLK